MSHRAEKLSHSTKTFRRGTLLCCVFGKFLGAKKLWIKRQGVSKFSVEVCLAHSTETFRGGTFQCIVSETFWWRKSLWIRRGEYQKFASKIFCLTVPKNFVGEPFSFSLISGFDKIFASKGYVTIFCRNFLASQYRNSS